MCCDILGCIDVIAIHVSVCVLDAIIVCVYRHACDTTLYLLGCSSVCDAGGAPVCLGGHDSDLRPLYA